MSGIECIVFFFYFGNYCRGYVKKNNATTISQMKYYFFYNVHAGVVNVMHAKRDKFLFFFRKANEKFYTDVTPVSGEFLGSAQRSETMTTGCVG